MTHQATREQLTNAEMLARADAAAAVVLITLDHEHNVMVVQHGLEEVDVPLLLASLGRQMVEGPDQ